MPVDYTSLKKEWQLLKDAKIEEIYAGLQEVAGRLNKYFTRLGEKDDKINFFQTIYHQVTRHSISPLPAEQNFEPVAEMPDFTASQLLADRKQNNEATIQEGRELFLAFAEAFRPGICSNHGVMGSLYKGVVNTQELAILLATHLINAHLSNQSYWYVFALLISLLIEKEGIESFCAHQGVS